MVVIMVVAAMAVMVPMRAVAMVTTVARKNTSGAGKQCNSAN
jgi:hypothetical protein